MNWSRLAMLLASLALSCGDDTGSEVIGDVDAGGTSDVVDEPDTDDAADDSQGEPDAPEPFCGDGEVNGDDECDDGPDNADDANCLLDCRINPIQHIVLTEEDLELGVDAAASTDHAAVGAGSWCMTPEEDENGDGSSKFELWFPTSNEVIQHLGNFTIGDIADIRLTTLKLGEPDNRNFRLLIYSVPVGPDDTGDWYERRLSSVTHQARELDDPEGEWVEWRTASGTNQLTFYDTAETPSGPRLPTLHELTATDAFDWSDITPEETSATEIDYASMAVHSVSVQTDSAWSDTFLGCIDALRIDLVDGRALVFDLER